MGNKMRLIIYILPLITLSSFAYAGDLIVPKLDEDWISIESSKLNGKYQSWNFRLWQNRKNGDLLVFATDPIGRPLDSYADLDRAMDFASSAHPEWMNHPAFANWQSEKANYDPRFLKLEKTKLKNREAEIAKEIDLNAIEYCMVSDYEQFPFMANGIVTNVNERTYYVQLISKRPISNSIPRKIIEQLQKAKRQ